MMKKYIIALAAIICCSISAKAATPTVSKESGEGSKDIADNINLSNKTKSKTIETKDAGKGTAYYLCVENAANVIITRMTLVYAL